jgi:hypothetical protein
MEPFLVALGFFVICGIAYLFADFLDKKHTPAH